MLTRWYECQEAIRDEKKLVIFFIQVHRLLNLVLGLPLFGFMRLAQIGQTRKLGENQYTEI